MLYEGFWRGSGLAGEQPIEPFLDFRFPNLTGYSGSDAAFRIEERRCRYGLAQAEFGQVIARSAHPHGKADSRLLYEFGNAGARLYIIQRCRDECHAAVLVLALGGYQERQFRFARAAPSGPQIQDHDLAAEIAQVDACSAEIVEGEINGLRL